MCLWRCPTERKFSNLGVNIGRSSAWMMSRRHKIRCMTNATNILWAPLHIFSFITFFSTFAMFISEKMEGSKICWSGAWHELLIVSFVLAMAVANPEKLPGQQHKRYNKMQHVMTRENTFCERHKFSRIWEYTSSEEFRPPTLLYVTIVHSKWSLFWNASLYNILF